MTLGTWLLYHDEGAIRTDKCKCIPSLPAASKREDDCQRDSFLGKVHIHSDLFSVRQVEHNMELWKNGFRARTTRGSARQGPINFPIRLFGLLLPILSQIRGASNTSPSSPKDRVPRNRSKFLLQRPLSGETRKLWHGSHIRLHCLLPPSPRAGGLWSVGSTRIKILRNRSYCA